MTNAWTTCLYDLFVRTSSHFKKNELVTSKQVREEILDQKQFTFIYMAKTDYSFF